MLTFLFGTDISAKRAYVDREVVTKARAGGRVRLVVPEQENFNRDRRLMETYGERDANACRTTSFTHFAAEYLEEKGVPLRPAADGAGQTLLMSLALRQCRDSLTYYARYDRRQGSLAQLLSFYKEMKNAGLTPADLAAVGGTLSGSLAAKARELQTVFAAYEGLLGERFSDAAENLNVLSQELQKHDDLADTEFYFDDFRGFTAPQLRLIEALLQKAKNVFVSLTTDSPVMEDSLCFAHALDQHRVLKRFAQRAGVRVREEPVAPEAGEGGLSKLRRDLFRELASPAAGTPEDVALMQAANKYELCDFIAMRVNELLLSGACRARDVAVLYRDETITPILLSAMKKYGVPAFADRRRALYTYPLVRMLLSALKLVSGGFETETVLSYLKTDVAGVGMEAVSALENYAYRWQIDGKNWEKPFTGSPAGFGNDLTDEDVETLAALNETRASFMRPLMKLRGRLKDGTGKSDAEAAFLFLKEVKADAHFLAAAERLAEAGEETEALAYAGVWDQCMSALDTLAGALGDTPLEPQAFYELMTLLFHTDSVGSVPPGVDKVQCGQIDRVRALDPYVLFLPDFTEGTYPRSASAGKLLSPKELRALSEADFDLGSLPEKVYEEEKLIVFTALTSPRAALYLGLPDAAVTGEALSPSTFLSDVKALFGDLAVERFGDLPPERRVLTPDAAFERLAGLFGEAGAEKATVAAALQAAFPERDAPKVLTAAAAGIGGEFTDPENARRLFGDTLFFSASKTEQYHTCPFAYLCRYGLGAEKLEVSRIDARINGLLVHEALEVILRRHRGEAIADLPDETIREETREAVENYIRDSLSGRENLPPAVLRSLSRVQDDIIGILSVIRQEFKDSSFVMRDMELKIGDGETGVPAYVLPLSDGGRVVLTGSVDRVDTMDLDGTSYLRVVDYKTGGKEFRLSDVFSGLNMQMLLYLFALCDNGKARYNEPLPAGILYVPAKTSGETVGRRADEAAIYRQRLANGRMNGLLLANESVIRGMERDAKGVYINASVTDAGELKGNLLTGADFRRLHAVTDRILREMGENIRRGAFPPLPIEKSGQGSVCDYCSYAAVCLKESGCEKRPLKKLKHDEAVEWLREEAEQNG